MTRSLFNPAWYRVADRRARLRADVRVQSQHQRDQGWTLLTSTTDAQQLRLDERAWRFVGRCDGRQTIQQVWDALLDEYRDDAPTQGEVIQLLGRLDQAGMLAQETAGDTRTPARGRPGRKRRTGAFVNPFALKIPLGNPGRLLDRFGRLPAYLFNVWTLWLWIGVALFTVFGAAGDWNALSTHARAYMATPRHLVLAWVLFPLLKTVHELAHALAVRRWGGEVREAGFSLFVLVPAPYVDASAANAFRIRSQRAIVGLAGIMAEFAVAAFALLVWFNVQPGLVQDAAFVTLFLAGVTTVLFNANPLLSFDGYYVLCDLLDLPNLSSRSRAWWADRLRRIAFGRSAQSAVQPARGEGKWLACYAPLSIAWRIFVSALLVLWIGAHSFLLGAAAMVLLAFLLFVGPLWSGAGRMLMESAAIGKRTRALTVAVTSAIAIAIIVCFVPLPYHTVAGAVVWLPDHARVRADVDGFIVGLPAHDGDAVVAGQPLVALEDPALLAERERLASEFERLQATRFGALRRDALEARNADEEIQRVRGDLERITQKIDGLILRARVDGVLVMPRQQDLPGTFARRGATLGYVLERREMRVRAAVPEFDAPLVRDRTHAAEALTAESGDAVPAQLLHDIPAATFELPSAALGDRGGGALATDPADTDGLRTLEPVVLVDLTLTSVNLKRIGGRAWVRFDHGVEPLAGRWYRRLRQLLLQHFNPAS
ncbi:MAG: PqqD family peptide modification chaperone [Betaproteobacteria bacterium]